MNVKSLPAEERPRERLARFGAEALSTVELLAILLGSGTKERPVLDLAAALLARFQSLNALSRATLAELSEVKGIGRAKAIQLQAAFALFYRNEEKEQILLDQPRKVYGAVRFQLERQTSEVLMIVLRDVRRQLIHKEIISKGTLTELILHPREIFHAAISHRAHSLIIAHNHPSGDPTPSSKDLKATQALLAAGKVIGIPLADHLIIGKSSYVSFYEASMISGWDSTY